MPREKKPSRPPDSPPWQVILEEIRSQNRATIESVEASRSALEQRIDRLDQDSRSRDGLLEMAIRELRLTVQHLQGDVKVLQGDVRQVQGDVTVLQGGVRQVQGDVRDLQGDVRQVQGDVKILQGDVRGLTAKVEALVRIDERVTALENRLA